MADTQKDEPVDVPNDYTRTPWAEILKGWEHVPGDGLHDNGWVPPGRTRSAAYADEHGILYVFTTSTEFEAGTPYTKFEAYALLNHGGDRHAAEADLHSQGFGVFRRRDGDGN